jgi:transcription antitermination factor NusG
MSEDAFLGAPDDQSSRGVEMEGGAYEAPWYALQVRPRYEKLVAELLQNKGVEGYLPLYKVLRRWSDRSVETELPLFPGYVFCRLDWTRRILPVLTTPGVVRVLGVGPTPSVVDERELQVVRLIEKSGRAARPWPMPQIGEPVCIEHGPLTGVEGVLVGLKKHRRLVVSITLLRRSVAVEIEEQWVRPVKRRWAAPALAEMICVDSVAGRA